LHRLAEGVVIAELAGDAAAGKQKQILLGIERCLQRRDRQTAIGLRLCDRNQRTAGDQIGRQQAGGLQEIATPLFVSPRND